MAQALDQNQATAAAAGVDPVASNPGRGTRIGTIILLVLIFGSLLWYFVADRLTPYSSHARVQAFVVPVAAEVAGKVLAVHVKNNDEVERGQPLFEIDPTQYRIALQRSRADYESVRHSVNATVATVEAARSSLRAARANRIKADKDATRQKRCTPRIAAPSRYAGWRSPRRTGSRRAARSRPPKRTCARPRKPPARPVTTMPSCAARVPRSRRPSWIWRARRWSPPPPVW